MNEFSLPIKALLLVAISNVIMGTLLALNGNEILGILMVLGNFFLCCTIGKLTRCISERELEHSIRMEIYRQMQNERFKFNPEIPK